MEVPPAREGCDQNGPIYLDLSRNSRHLPGACAVDWNVEMCLARAVMRPQTNVARVYAEIRADILAGRAAPGARLQLTPLVQRYGSSMGVVREALFTLVAENLVTSEAQVGFRVVDLSLADLRQLVEARCVIETHVLMDSIRSGNLEWETRVIAAHHRLRNTPQQSGEVPGQMSEAWSAAHATFHATLLDAAVNHRMRLIAESLRDSFELYHYWAMPTVVSAQRDIAQEHLALMEAAMARDLDGAAGILRRHIERTAEALTGRSSVLGSEFG